MSRVVAYLRSLQNPMKLLQALTVVGGLGVAYALLSAFGSNAPKAWENEDPVYIVGAVAKFERTFPSQGLPNVRLESEDGQVRLPRLAQGKPLVVNLWATWCAPCLHELPALAALQSELGDGVEVLAIAMESGDGSRQRQMLDRLGAGNLELLWDPSLSLGRQYSDDLKLPITVIYDARGREIGRLEGAADWSAPEAVRLVKAISGGAIPR